MSKMMVIYFLFKFFFCKGVYNCFVIGEPENHLSNMPLVFQEIFQIGGD